MDRFASIVVALMLTTCAIGVTLADDFPSPFEVFSPPVNAPTVSFKSPDGNTLGLEQWKGRVLVLNIWATWCGPCVREIPSLDRLSKKVRDAGIDVIAVSQDKGGSEKSRSFFEINKVELLSAYSDPQGTLSQSFGVRGMPTTLILDTQGRVVARLEGEAEWDSDAIVESLRSLAGAKK
jgi:thiol-disulfide isomerase/thioredoxin